MRKHAETIDQASKSKTKQNTSVNEAKCSNNKALDEGPALKDEP